MGFSRKHFAVVALDGPFRVAAVAPLVTRIVKKRAEAKASDLGIGIASMFGFSDTSKALQVRARGGNAWCMCAGMDTWDHSLSSSFAIKYCLDRARSWTVEVAAQECERACF